MGREYESHARWCFVNDSEVIREFLIESSENLGRLDQELVLDSSLFDNLHEILNIFGQVFRGKILDSVTLHKVSPLSELEAGPAKNLVGFAESAGRFRSFHRRVWRWSPYDLLVIGPKPSTGSSSL